MTLKSQATSWPLSTFSFSVLSRIIQLSPFLSLLSNTFGNIFAYFFNDAKVTYHSIGFLNSIHSYMFTSLNFSRLLFSYLQLIDNASTATLCHLRLWNRGLLQSNRWKLQNIQGWNYLLMPWLFKNSRFDVQEFIHSFCCQRNRKDGWFFL